MGRSAKATSKPHLSVVVASYNRPLLLERLLGQLSEQKLPSGKRFEVVVVDDGSSTPVKAWLSNHSFPFSLQILEQANGGAARARHHGVSKALGDVLVIVDDDMEVPDNFLAEHWALHRGEERVVVFGRIRPSPESERLPLFERYNAINLERTIERYASGATPRGNQLCTGNVSMRRVDYLEVGGFDLSLERSEDAELGIRLEQSGVRPLFSEAPYVVHHSDHDQVSTFLSRAARYGKYDFKISQKHPGLAHADPYRYLFSLNVLTRPWVGSALVAPQISKMAARALMASALTVDKMGLEPLALRMTGIVYGMEYFRGIREESGTLGSALKDCVGFLAKSVGSDQPAPVIAASAAKAVSDLKEDLVARRHYERKYQPENALEKSAPVQFVEKIGLQLAGAYRVMQFFKDAHLGIGAKVASRMIRHLYGSDIHWNAEFSPGISFVHGMGLAISSHAKVGPGCILSQNVTLGMGRDSLTGETGAPTLERDVQVGPGATLIGPITVGAGSKIGPGAVVTRSIPANSVVEAPAPNVRSRVGKKPGKTSATGQLDVANSDRDEDSIQ